MKNYLFIFRKPPYNGASTQEMLDIVLTAAAFDNAVSILLVDDGVYQLKTNQHPELLAYKNTAAIFSALELYDVKAVYAEAESLQERNLSPEDLILSVTEQPRTQLSRLINQFDAVFSD